MSPAAEYAGLPLLPPYLHPGHPEYVYGVNFASGGSGALSQTSQGSVSSVFKFIGYYFPIWTMKLKTIC